MGIPRRTALTAVLSMATLATMVPAQPAAALPPPGPGVPVWASDWMKNGSGNTNYDPGRTLALRQARQFDVVVAHVGTYDNHMAAMRAANPNLRVFVYVQGMFTNEAGLPSSWYARNGAGSKIMSRAFDTYLMNPKSSGWRDDRLAECRRKLADSHYDGCFLDSLGPTGVSGESMTATPINPSTNRAYTRREWLAATETVAERVRSAMSPTPVLLNGLVDGPGYFNSTGPTERLLDGATGGMSEAFMRAATSGVTKYKGEPAWKNDVDMLADVGRRSSGGIALAITKVWCSASSSQIASWHRYALASFLLGYRPGHGYFQFRSNHELTTTTAYEDVVLGNPTSAYTRTNGLYVRSFQYGKVIVNPTTSSHSNSLSRRYVDLSGAYRSGSISLAAHTAQILKFA
jgi:putative glycosyl hydrolase-like family 15 (GHL15) protein